MKKYRVVAYLTVGVLAVILIVLVVTRSKNERFAGYAGDEKIRQEEWQIFLQDNRRTVISKVNQKYGIKYENEEFWKKVLPDGHTPQDLLRQQALTQLEEYKIMQYLMKKYGIIESTDYKMFLEQYEQYILDLEEKEKRGEIVYGKKIETEEEYYFYYYDIKLNALLEYLSENEFEYSEQIMDEAYESCRSQNLLKEDGETQETETLIRLEAERLLFLKLVESERKNIRIEIYELN